MLEACWCGLQLWGGVAFYNLRIKSLSFCGPVSHGWPFKVALFLHFQFICLILVPY